MPSRSIFLALILLACSALMAAAQTTEPDVFAPAGSTPATAIPTTQATDSDSMLNQMLGPSRVPAANSPTTENSPDMASNEGAPAVADVPPTSDELFSDAARAKQIAATQPVVKLTSPGKGRLLREGTDIFDRTGSLARTDSGQWAFVFDRVAGSTPLLAIEVLPSKQLLAMQAAIGAARHSLHFRISGSVTEYRDRNFLLITDVADRSSRLRPQAGGMQVDRTSGTGAVAPNAPELRLMQEGTQIPDRLARFERLQGGRAQVIFDSDGRDLQDPPMILLPNLKLASMENAVGAAENDTRFRVSGMVTEFDGRNYLLLSKAVVVVDRDQPF